MAKKNRRRRRSAAACTTEGEGAEPGGKIGKEEKSLFNFHNTYNSST